MSIKLRLAFLLGLLLLVFLSSLAAMREMEHRQLEKALAGARREEAQLLSHWLDLGAAPLRRFVEELALWPELDGPSLSPEAATYLRSARAQAGFAALWVLGADGTRLYADASAEALAATSPLPSAAFPLTTAPAEGRYFFLRTDTGLLEIRGRRHTGGDWIYAARLWDDEHLRHIGKLVEGRASLVPFAPSTTDGENDAVNVVVVDRPLLDWQTKPLGVLHIEKAAPDIGFRAETAQLKFKIFLAFGICLIGSLALSLHRWILKPLGWITDSLARNDTAPILPLLESRTELTRVARLIVTSFEHREQLRREIAERRHAETELQRTLEERARLGRNLHDSVIQSIYAAGMGVSTARKLTVTDPEEAKRRLAQVGDLLNDTIRDVRDFITGLEPETLSEASFAGTVERLFATMNPAGAARVELDLDDDIVGQLDAALRTELLLVLREAISNAIRHGGATAIEIALLPVGHDRARLQVLDNGVGFDPATVRRGNGLNNLFARARIRGARAEISSVPIKGTRLVLEFPLHEESNAQSAANPPPAPASEPAPQHVS